MLFTSTEHPPYHSNSHLVLELHAVTLMDSAVAGVWQQLSWTDRLLSFWIIGAMGLGLILGKFTGGVVSQHPFDVLVIEPPVEFAYYLSYKLHACESACACPHQVRGCTTYCAMYHWAIN